MAGKTAGGGEVAGKGGMGWSGEDGGWCTRGACRSAAVGSVPCRDARWPAGVGPVARGAAGRPRRAVPRGCPALPPASAPRVAHAPRAHSLLPPLLSLYATH